MEMVPHLALGMNLSPGFLARLGQRFETVLSINIIDEIARWVLAIFIVDILF
jgi:hypothetical protein